MEGESAPAGHTSGLNDSQDSVSMVEILEEEQQREDDANAVLGASDDKHCTYPQGALSRQALYSCATCVTDDKQPAGVCLACCLECHEGHDLYELYTKRNFCCDCGNSKFGEKKCKLWPTKKSVNTDNKYNQNFRGEYCTCHRPYPDPDDEIDDDMIQCVVCEDWFHGRHLGTKVPAGNAFEEMICLLCVQRHQFLYYYKHLQVPQGAVTKVTVDDPKEDVDVCSPAADSSVAQGAVASEGSAKEVDTSAGGTETISTTAMSSSSSADTVTKNGPPTTTNSQDEQSTSEACLLRSHMSRCDPYPGSGISLFWARGWRTELCRCTSCKETYEKGEIAYITEETDTITNYEDKGRQGVRSQYEKGMEALSQMNRVQQVEMISGYNNLKSELTEYLKKFADNGKVVKEENIQEFFTSLASRKRQRVEIPYHCK